MQCREDKASAPLRSKEGPGVNALRPRDLNLAKTRSGGCGVTGHSDAGLHDRTTRDLNKWGSEVGEYGVMACRELSACIEPSSPDNDFLLVCIIARRPLSRLAGHTYVAPKRLR
jgi:hypothetical protein